MNCSNCCQPRYACCCSQTSNYGCFNFLLDTFMIVITGGLWLVWIFIREMRKR